MTAPRVRGGLALRIWLVTVTSALATGLAGFLVVRLASQEPYEGRRHGFARYAAEQLAQRWGDDDAVRGEVARLAALTREEPAVYRWSGEVVAAGSPAPPPLGPGDLEALARDGMLERGEDCPRGPCDVAFPLPSGGRPVAYAVLRRPPPPGPRPSIVPPLALLLGGLGIAAVLLGASLARPLDRLARTAHALGSGDLAARTGVRRRDELGAVAQAFDEMADRVVGLLRGQTELMANVAHELRTPLARIGVALDLAAEGDAAVARESLAEIREDLTELERLVDDVLASARMDLSGTATATGVPPLRRAPLDVGALVEGAADRLRQRYPERTVLVELEPGLPRVDGDTVLLRRAVENLLDNARKYSAEEVRARAVRRGEGVAIEVIDRGEGIAPEDLAQLFTPFFRADRSRARATGGVGLGLALSRRIAEAHGGTLVAASAVGEGTTMTLTLPAAGSQAP